MSDYHQISISGMLVFIIVLFFGSCQVSEDTVDENGPNPPVNQSQNNQNASNNINLAQVQQAPNQQQSQQFSSARLGTTSNRPEYDTIQPPVPPPARNRIQVALLLDTSNSMDGLIDQAKSQLWKMVNELAKATKEEEAPQIELSLFEYGNDWLSSEAGYIRKVGRLTIDLEWISDKLFKLTTNGGDEYCPWAIRDAAGILDWSDNPNDLKIIFIAGNEPFAQGPVTVRQACERAKEKGIIVNTIHCGGYDEGIRDGWGDLAACTGGKYMNIDQNEKVVHIPTPYDDEVLALNKKLNDTYIGYGSKGSSYKEMQVANDASAGNYSSANTRTRAFYKTKKNYSNTSWDLVDATEKDYDGFMKGVETKELPEEMQKMSKEEQKEYVDQKRTERQELQKELKTLEQKVDAYIVEKRKEMAEGDTKNTLDNVMMDAIRKQAEDKGFKF